MTLPETISEVEHEHNMMTFAALLAMACFGGIVKWCRNPQHKKRTTFSFITCFCTAGFVGLMAHFLMTWLNIDMSLQFAISGAAGYSGGVLLDAAVPFFLKLVYRKMGVKYPEEHTSARTGPHDTAQEQEQEPENEE